MPRDLAKPHPLLSSLLFSFCLSTTPFVFAQSQSQSQKPVPKFKQGDRPSHGVLIGVDSYGPSTGYTASTPPASCSGGRILAADNSTCVCPASQTWNGMMCSAAPSCISTAYSWVGPYSNSNPSVGLGASNNYTATLPVTPAGNTIAVNGTFLSGSATGPGGSSASVGTFKCGSDSSWSQISATMFNTSLAVRNCDDAITLGGLQNNQPPNPDLSPYEGYKFFGGANALAGMVHNGRVMDLISYQTALYTPMLYAFGGMVANATTTYNVDGSVTGPAYSSLHAGFCGNLARNGVPFYVGDGQLRP